MVHSIKFSKKKKGDKEKRFEIGNHLSRDSGRKEMTRSYTAKRIKMNKFKRFGQRNFYNWTYWRRYKNYNRAGISNP